MHILSPFDAGAASIRVGADLSAEFGNANRVTGTVSLGKGQSGTVTLSPSNPDSGGTSTIVFTVSVASDGTISVSADTATGTFTQLTLGLEVLTGAAADRFRPTAAGVGGALQFVSWLVNGTSGTFDNTGPISGTDYFGIYNEFDASAGSYPAGTALLFFKPVMITGMPTAADFSTTITADASGVATTQATPVFIDPDTGAPITPDSLELQGPSYGTVTVVGDTLHYTSTGLDGTDTISFDGLFGGIFTYPATVWTLTVAQPAPSAAFWRDALGCVDQNGLRKLEATVLVPEVPQVDYRPYSKTCPPPSDPPHTPRWVTKTLCGTVTHYLLLSGDQVVGYDSAYLINYNGKVVLDKHVTQITNPALTPNASQLAYEEPFCAPVKVYE